MHSRRFGQVSFRSLITFLGGAQSPALSEVERALLLAAGAPALLPAKILRRVQHRASQLAGWLAYLYFALLSRLETRQAIHVGRRGVIFLMAALTALSSVAQAQLNEPSSLLLISLAVALASSAAAVSLLKDAFCYSTPHRALVVVRFACLLLIFTTGSLSAIAQTAADLNSHIGVEPFRSYQFGNVDTIDLMTGRLVVDIPLISYPQRGGKLKLNYVLHYHNAGAVLGGMTGCIPVAVGSGCVVFPYDSGFGWGEKDTPIAGTTCDGGGNAPPGAVNCLGRVVAPDGAVHQLVPIGQTSFRAMDGSGYRLDMPPKFILSSADMSYVLVDPDGTRFSRSPDATTITAEDINGNEMVIQGAQVTDTIGRLIPGIPWPVPFPSSFPDGISGSTADYTGCSGPLQITGAIVWNPPGLNGGTYPLKFCFVSVTEIMPPDQHFTNPSYTTTATQLQNIVLPNGSNWTFQYATDGTGNLVQIVFPSGGTLSYTWINPQNPGVQFAPPFAVATRTLNPNSASPSGTLQYHYSPNYGNVFPSTNTVTDSAGNDAVHVFGKIGDSSTGFDFRETSTQFYQGSARAVRCLKMSKETTKWSLRPTKIV